MSEPLPLRLTDGEVRDLVERMLSTTGRRVDLSTPFVDASLPDGSRLHVASGDVARGAMSINIRKFARRLSSLAALVERDDVVRLGLRVGLTFWRRLRLHLGLGG